MDKLNAISTLVIATATVVNLFVSFFMWSTARDTIAQTDTLYVSLHRPQIGVGDIETEVDSIGKRLTMKLYLKNYGDSPGMVKSGKFVHAVGNRPLEGHAQYFPTLLFPTSASPLVLYLTGNDFNEFVNKGDSLQIVLDIHYEDVAHHPHRTYTNSMYHYPTKFVAARESYWN